MCCAATACSDRPRASVPVTRMTVSSASPVAPRLARRVTAEFFGTGLLVTIVVGSGIAAERLSPGDAGLQLLENSLATGLGLAVLILMFAPVSGAHLNPVVSLAEGLLWRRSSLGIRLRDVMPYIAAQVGGAIGGTLLASVMFDVAPAFSTTERASFGRLLGEVVATAGLVLLIFTLSRTSSRAVTATAVGAYIAAAYWFTSSTAFANPAVTIARMFTDTFAGIDPASVIPFIVAQLVGAGVGIVLFLVLYPSVQPAAVHSPSLTPAKEIS